MEKRLKWNAIGLKKKTELLLAAVTAEDELTPVTHSKIMNKLQGFKDELASILETMERIQTQLVPALENRLRLKFPTPELVMLALSRPGLRTIFEQVSAYFGQSPKTVLSSEEFAELASSGDAANVLALVGDAVLDLAVVQAFWGSSVSTAGALTTKRAELASNAHLAQVCDQWELYDYRLTRLHEQRTDLLSKKATEHEKATLIEALYGVIYLELGFEAISRVVPHIQLG